MPINRGKQYARTSSLATAPLWVALLFGIQLVSVGPIDDERPATVTHASGDFDWQSAPARYGDHAAVEGGWITLTSPHRPPLRSLADDAPAGWPQGPRFLLAAGHSFPLAVRTQLDAARYGRDSFHSTAVPPPTS